MASSLRPLALDEGAAPQAGHAAGGAFDGERIGHTASSLDSGAASSEQPQPAVRVEIAGVASAVPDGARDLHLGLLVADATEIASQHVIAGDDDLAGAASREGATLESGRISEGERMPPAVRQYAQRNRRRRDAGKDTGAGVHGEAIGMSDRIPVDRGNRLGFGRTVDRHDRSRWSGTREPIEQRRKHWRAAGEDTAQMRKALCAVGQPFQQRR